VKGGEERGEGGGVGGAGVKEERVERNDEPRSCNEDKMNCQALASK